MAWSTPTAPTAGTTITVSWATTNLIDNLSWLRRLTGNADPTAANQVLVSSGTTLAAWGTLPDAAMAVQKVTRAGDTMTGDLAVTRSGIGSPGSGYVFLGNTGPYIGYDGSNVVISGNIAYHAGNAAMVPSGAIVAFATAAELTAAGAGWARYTNADGRGLIGAGTAGGKTFTENTAVNPTGGNWVDNTGAPSGTVTAGSGGTTAGSGTHTHTMDLTFPARVVVFGRKT
jgi:hypothetical protein